MRINAILSSKIIEVNVLLTILIVWLHVSAYYGVSHYISDIAIIAVPCFWALSSFLYFKSFDFEKPWKSYKAKVISRTKSLLIPFLIFSLFGMIFNLIAYEIRPVVDHPLSNVSWGNLWKYIYESKANGPLWYLRSLYAFILVAPIIGYIIRWTKWSLFLVFPIYFGCRYIGYFYFPYWMVDIFIGAYIAIYYDDLSRIPLFFNSESLKWWGGVALLASYIIGDEYFLRTIAPLCIIFIMANIQIIPKKVSGMLAPYTMLIYCLHLPISRIASKLPGLIGVTYPVAALIIGTVLTILMIIGIGALLKKSPMLWGILTGGR